MLFLLSDEHNFRCQGRLDDSGPGEPVETPTLDDLASSSTVFERAYCSAPLCLPSRLSILTGLEAQRCRAWGNPEHGENMTLDADLTTIPGAFSQAGYETALVGKMHLDGNRQFVGFDRRPYGDLTGGIGHQPDPPTPSMDGGYGSSTKRIREAGVSKIPESQLQEHKVIRESLSFLRERHNAAPDQPWFLCASFSRPHFPLSAPRRFVDMYWPDGVSKPKVGREGDTADHPLTEAVHEYRKLSEVTDKEQLGARAAYFACVSFLDQLLGDFLVLLDRDGFLDDTVVVYTSDHGELAGEHGLWWKQTWHEASTRVPLYVQLPGHRSGRVEPSRLNHPVSLMDLFPTLCDLADIDAPGNLDGESLAAPVRSGEEPDRGPVVCDNLNDRFGPGTEFRTIWDEDHKYVRFRGAPDLLFDLSSDPLQRRDLTGERTDVESKFREFADRTVDFERIERRRTSGGNSPDDDTLDAPKGTSGNAYHLPDGRIVDADTPLYDPDVLVEDPASAFPDFPAE